MNRLCMGSFANHEVEFVAISKTSIVNSFISMLFIAGFAGHSCQDGERSYS